MNNLNKFCSPAFIEVKKHRVVYICFSVALLLFCCGIAWSGSTFTDIDVHSHLAGKVSATVSDFEGAADIAITAMDKKSVQTMLVLPPPFTNQASQANAIYECTDMSSVLTKYPDRFAFICGGGTLNVLLQKAVTGETITVDQFKTKAYSLANTTGFVGFGEMAALHFCLGTGHVYQSAPPDHELFKALVDVASEKNVPVDIHMEAVVNNMNFPTLVTGGCTANPATLSANIAQFKSLLSYAKTKTPSVKIIWDHLGWDNTGQRTAALSDELLGQYDNLYMSLKHSPKDSPTTNQILDSSNNIKSEWLALFQKYPAHFIIGADNFFVSPKINATFPPSFDETWTIISKLPADLAAKIGYENARSIFNICNLTISPTSQTFASSGGIGSVTVTPSSSSCAWTATESLDWVSITSGSSGTGSGTVSYSVSANTSTSSRSGNMTIAGQSFTVTQTSSAQDNCAATVSSSLVVHIPVITYSGSNYWVDLAYNSGNGTLSLTNAGIVNDTTPYSSCTASTLSSDFKLHIPVLILDGISYWADFQYNGSVFVISGGGQNY